MADLQINKRITIMSSEISFTSSKSSGPGGQHVNKTESKATLKWSFSENQSLKVAEVDRLIFLAGKRVKADGCIHLSSEAHRSQKKNQQECLKRLRELVIKAITPPKKRKPTKVPRRKKEERLKAKRKQSEKKSLRREKF